MTVSPSPEQLSELVDRLRKRAEIRRQIPGRKSVLEGAPDRISDLLEEAADALQSAQSEIARLNDRLVETQMLSFKWMEAHDKLKAGEPYSFPSPADLPKALAEIARLTTALERIEEHYTDTGLAAKHMAAIARAALKDSPNVG